MNGDGKVSENQSKIIEFFYKTWKVLVPVTRKHLLNFHTEKGKMK